MRGPKEKVFGGRELIWIEPGGRLGWGNSFPSHCHVNVLLATLLSSSFLCGLVFKLFLMIGRGWPLGTWGGYLGPWTSAVAAHELGILEMLVPNLAPRYWHE